MIKRELKKCTQCNNDIEKSDYHSWDKYSLRKFCSEKCAYQSRKIDQIFRRTTKPMMNTPLMYQDYLKKHADQL